MVTVERLVAIRSPFQANTLLKHSRIVMIIIITFVWTFFLQLYNFFWLRPSTVPNCLDFNKIVYIMRQVRPTNGYHKYRFVVFSKIVTPIITVPLPLILLIVLNALLLYYLKTNRREVAKISSGCTSTSKSENKVTLMVLVIVFTFFVFNFPSAVVYFLFIFHPSPGHLAVYSLTANYMVTLNKALNFWLYCLASANFRKKLRRLCRNLFSRYDQNQNKMYLNSMTGKYSVKNSRNDLDRCGVNNNRHNYETNDSVSLL